MFRVLNATQVYALRLVACTWCHINPTEELYNTHGDKQTTHANRTAHWVLCKLFMRKEQHSWFYANYTCERNNTLDFMQTTHANGTAFLILCILHMRKE